MWVLILTMMFTGPYYDSSPGVALHSVPGFTSEASCLRAGNAWLEQQNKADVAATKRVRAMCVKQ